MARIRTVKPEYWSDKTISQLSLFSQLFYIALWNFADDAGRGRANAKELNGLIFSERDDVENYQVEDAMQELADLGRILLYEDGDTRLFQIVKWAEHQVINRPSRSKFPRPEGFTECATPLPDDSLSTHGEFTEPSHTPQCMEDGRRKTEDGSRNLEDGRRTAEGGPGETAAPEPSVPEQIAVPSVSVPSFGASSGSVPSPPPTEPLRRHALMLSDADRADLLRSAPSPDHPPWTMQEICWGVEIAEESTVKPRNLKGLLHRSILPEVRAGKRPARIAHAPPTPPNRISEAERERLIEAQERDRAKARRLAAVFEAKRQEGAT